VQNVEPIQDRAEVNHPAQSVGHFVPAVHRASANSPVSFYGHVRAGENPAGLFLGNTAPETIQDVIGKSLRDQVRKAINLFRHIGLSIQRLIWLGVRGGDHRSDADFFLTQTS
jgi:hypothetical protein